MGACPFAGCGDATESQFCDRHRCRGLTAKAKGPDDVRNRCASSVNCGIVHKSYMNDVVPATPSTKAVSLPPCKECGTVYTPAADKLQEQIVAFAANDQTCRRCRQSIADYVAQLEAEEQWGRNNS